MTELTFAHLREVNVARCVEGWNHPLNGWTAADWLIAVGGELGETLNVVKKLNRERDGIIGNSKSADALRADLADELADTVIYLDLLMAAQGKLLTENGEGSFADVAKIYSYTIVGAPADFVTSDVAVSALRAMGELAAACVDEQHMHQNIAALTLLGCLHGVAKDFSIALGDAVVRKFNATSEKHGMPHRLVPA